MYDSKCPSVRPSQLFRYLPGIQSSWNWNGVCILEKVTSGHSFRGWKKLRSIFRGDKLVIWGHFFVLLRTPSTVLIGGCWKCIGMFFVTIRTNVMRRNFEFLPSRSDTPTLNPFRTFANSIYNFDRRVLKFNTDVLWDHTQKRNAAEFWIFALKVRYSRSKVKPLMYHLAPLMII